MHQLPKTYWSNNKKKKITFIPAISIGNILESDFKLKANHFNKLPDLIFSKFLRVLLPI